VLVPLFITFLGEVVIGAVFTTWSTAMDGVTRLCKVDEAILRKLRLFPTGWTLQPDEARYC
jgi:hypothetical protein